MEKSKLKKKKTLRPPIATLRLMNVFIRLPRRSNFLYFRNSTVRRSAAWFQTSLTRINFLASLSFSANSYSNRNFLFGIFFPHQMCSWKPLDIFWEFPMLFEIMKVAPVDTFFLLREKWLHSLGIFWNGSILSKMISKWKIPAFLMHLPQIRVSSSFGRSRCKYPCSREDDNIDRWNYGRFSWVCHCTSHRKVWRRAS